MIGQGTVCMMFRPKGFPWHQAGEVMLTLTGRQLTLSVMVTMTSCQLTLSVMVTLTSQELTVSVNVTLAI